MGWAANTLTRGYALNELQAKHLAAHCGLMFSAVIFMNDVGQKSLPSLSLAFSASVWKN